MIHILDDDSLLNVFYFYRPSLLGEGEDEDDDARLTGGRERWIHGRWWYRLVHVCQRWRNIVFGSSSYLALSLVSTNGTPVASMLAHSPHLPLIIDYSDEYRRLTAEDEEGAILALKQCDRIRGIRLFVPTMSLEKFIVAINEKYPILEYLIIGHLVRYQTAILELPVLETLEAPHLRRLALIDLTLPIGSRFLTSAVGLVTFYHFMVNSSTYFHPNTLLQWLSLVPGLEMLTIGFLNDFPSLYSESESSIITQLTYTPIMTPVTLPNLHCLKFRGEGTYLEELVRRITTPRLERILILLSNEIMPSVSHLGQFMNTTESLRFDSAKFILYFRRVNLKLYSRGEAEKYALSITIPCSFPTSQVSTAAQISKMLSQVFSVVEHLSFEEVHTLPSAVHSDVDPTVWHKLLRSFNNVKTLLITERLIEHVSLFLQLNDREVPLELLPNLQELTYSGIGNHTGDEFTPFIDARWNTGHPIALIRY